MQKSETDQKNKNIISPSSLIGVCPRCGDGHTRRSSSKTIDGVLKIFFYKFYRCQACRFRFKQLNSLRVIWFAGLAVFFIPVFGAIWVASNEQPRTVSFTETSSQDTVKDLAEKGDPDAEFKMGLRHTSIVRGVKNDRIAVKWFEKAARHDHFEAQYRFGSALLNGQGVVQNYKDAFYWLEKAARQGSAKAQFDLGDMYYSGISINKDIQLAYLWFNLAAAQGIEKAVSLRDIVVKLLTYDQIAILQQEAGHISSGYRLLSVLDKSRVEMNELALNDEDRALFIEPITIDKKPIIKSLVPTIKRWWKDNL